MAIEVINPATGETIKSYPEMTDSEIYTILNKAHKDYMDWSKTPLADRSKCLQKLAYILEENKNKYAQLMAIEMGKPLKQGRAEIEKCAWTCEYFAENADNFLQDQQIKTEAAETFVTFQPIGIILAIMPWNFPFWQAIRAAVPALLAGNGMVLKHSSNTPDCALSIETLFQQAGFPKNLFRTLMIGPRKASSVIAYPEIRAVTLTGSSEAGKKVASEAGALLKKVVLELGGSDPYIVLKDANIKETVEACVTARMLNSGQSCIAAKRFIVEGPVFKEFTHLFIEEMKKYEPGDPLDENTRLGPMARMELRDHLHRQVKRSVDQGATVLLGGEIPSKKGAFYPPTVLADVRPGMPAYDEELFGPVASLIFVEDEEEAVRLANDTKFGLGGAVFTQDIDKGRKIARDEIQAGACFVNNFVKSDPRLPFGGIKQSGFGRELSQFGIHEFVNIKTVSIK